MSAAHQIFMVALVLIASIAGGIYTGSIWAGIAIAAALVALTHKPAKTA